MRRAAVVLLVLALQACATQPHVARDCPPLPTLPATPTAAQRDRHTEAIVAQYLRCAGVTP